ncbi:Rab GTPase [Cavenderia fasciculata]|uniref:Rab GTPase n=1 Tax=Cavenderia fasciculata TaxID=261658 RepID=F4QB65_CACFS|nr:Rab GTPase [Cavenderia fasciculata]EGG14837.1 Rab GTPase [Cavenderia fasciculata]|eukprot:XP_004351353.1 Rab GTPase [Cavenderia fasciculata]
MEEYHLKCIVTGPPCVGKSSLLLQFCEKEFSTELDTTVGVEFQSKTMELDGQFKIKLEIWDTAGQESFRSITNNYYRGAHIALLVYDITNRQSFQYLGSWLEEIAQMSTPNIVTLLIGNKCDAKERRVVTLEEAQRFAKSNDLIFIETSAKDNTNVEKVFEDAARQVITLIKQGKLVVVNKKPQISLISGTNNNNNNNPNGTNNGTNNNNNNNNSSNGKTGNGTTGDKKCC